MRKQTTISCLFLLIVGQLMLSCLEQHGGIGQAMSINVHPCLAATGTGMRLEGAAIMGIGTNEIGSGPETNFGKNGQQIGRAIKRGISPVTACYNRGTRPAIDYNDGTTSAHGCADEIGLSFDYDDETWPGFGYGGASDSNIIDRCGIRPEIGYSDIGSGGGIVTTNANAGNYRDGSTAERTSSWVSRALGTGKDKRIDDLPKYHSIPLRQQLSNTNENINTNVNVNNMGRRRKSREGEYGQQISREAEGGTAPVTAYYHHRKRPTIGYNDGTASGRGCAEGVDLPFGYDNGIWPDVGYGGASDLDIIDLCGIRPEIGYPDIGAMDEISTTNANAGNYPNRSTKDWTSGRISRALGTGKDKRIDYLPGYRTIPSRQQLSNTNENINTNVNINNMGRHRKNRKGKALFGSAMI